MKEIKTIIKPDGTTIIETSGFKGNACIEETERILQDLETLGISVGNKEYKKKAEYYEQPVTTGAQTYR
jgi:hypothetical protein